MCGTRRLQRGLGRWLLAGGLMAGMSGCLSGLHPIADPEADLVEACKVVPKCCRGHVFVFLLNGADPINKDNLSGVRDYLIGLGFEKVYYGQVYHACWFKKEIRRLHEEDPDAALGSAGLQLRGQRRARWPGNWARTASASTR